uniref:Phosphatidylcholine transfer protein n=1 Tax=Elaeophora elaphi TaxID=1147741 RepID=A0A0R3RGM1_9BILA
LLDFQASLILISETLEKFGSSSQAIRNRLLYLLFKGIRKVQLCKWIFWTGRRNYEKRWQEQLFYWRPQLLMVVTAVGFSFQENGISDEMILAEAKTSTDVDSEDWEVVRNEGNSKVLRRLHADTGLYEFRCSGSYDDITASDFVDAQMDLAFRKKWDTNVEKLELVRRDDDTDSELIHWVSKFPYPMYPREYVFVRRRYIDEKDRCIVIANCAVADSANIIPRCDKKYVRVETYRSILVVRAHKTFDCKGFDYILSYYDNPESNVPKYAYNWLVNYGGPYYLHQVHDAAKKLEQQRVETSINTAETIKVSSKASNDEGKSEEVDLSTERESKSAERDSETVNTADLELEMSLPLYDEKPKPISSPLEDYFIFVD